MTDMASMASWAWVFISPLVFVLAFPLYLLYLLVVRRERSTVTYSGDVVNNLGALIGFLVVVSIVVAVVLLV